MSLEVAIVTSVLLYFRWIDLRSDSSSGPPSSCFSGYRALGEGFLDGGSGMRRMNGRQRYIVCAQRISCVELVAPLVYP